MKKYNGYYYALLCAGLLILGSSFIIYEINNDKKNYAETPPLVDRIFVQKIKNAKKGHANMKMVVTYKIKYQEKIFTTYYYPEGRPIPVEFRDDGEIGDDKAGDGRYTAIFKDDIGKFLEAMNTRNENVLRNGSFTRFIGRTAEIVKPKIFNMGSFQAHQLTEIPDGLMLAFSCEAEIVPEKSLFITDLSVIEDPARTYNPWDDTGNPDGAWTFKTVMGNIINTNSTGLDARVFILDWFEQFAIDQTINGFDSESRSFTSVLRVMKHWLNRCEAAEGLVTTPPWDILDWPTLTSKFMLVTEESILKFAPFKLTAIVNRLDLRESLVYSGSGDTGETMFIYSILDDASNELRHSNPNPTSAVPAHFWEGMNVIFEYGNSQKGCSGAKAYGQKWKDLSDLNFSTDYDDSFNEALEIITSLVLDAGKGGNKINGSAINRIRSNERVFGEFYSANNQWDCPKWQLRQFLLNSNGYLEQSIVPNVPHELFNVAEVINNTIEMLTNQCEPDGLSYDDASADVLENWMISNEVQILSGNFQVPEEIGGVNVLAAEANMTQHESHYFDFEWNGTPPAEAVNLRHQLSANTCQGCHGGDTKTLFTQMHPMVYGNEANYWDINTYSVGTDQDNFQFVSPFITGYSINNQFGDDNPADDATDNSMIGDFFVNDPSGATDNYGNPVMHSFNELKRREFDLCALLDDNCGLELEGVAVGLINGKLFNPLPPNSH